MITLPRRSVTRFFIPLIDVLILLFCIFMLMPVVKRTGEGDGPETTPGFPGAKPTHADGESKAETAARLDRERQELERLRQEKIDTLQQRLAIQVLEIDGGTGRLYYHDPDRVEIASQADALALIDRHKRASGSRELYYLFLFPRQVKGRPLSGYPEEGQVRQYDRWFQGVAHGFDNPGSEGGRP